MTWFVQNSVESTATFPWWGCERGLACLWIDIKHRKGSPCDVEPQLLSFPYLHSSIAEGDEHWGNTITSARLLKFLGIKASDALCNIPGALLVNQT